MLKRSISKKLMWILAGLLWGSLALAQTNLETNAGIQFNFSTPGAANLALGGAYLAIVDDATAAYINPAGLPHLPSDEFHLELRGWSYTHVFTDRGSLEGRSLTFEGIDSISGLVDGEATDRLAGISFLSYVHLRKSWAFAFYWHQLANFETNFTTQGAFIEDTRSTSLLGIPGEIDGRLASLRNTMRLRIATQALSIAYRFNANFSVGANFAYHNFNLNSLTERIIPAFFTETDFNDPDTRIDNFQTQTGRDYDWSLSAGLLWQDNQRDWSVGMVYRQGPSFDLTTASSAALPFEEPRTARGKAAKFYTPEVYGFGIAFRPRDDTRVTLDYDHVRYSNLARRIVDVFDLTFFFPNLKDPETGKFNELDKFNIKDADELHLGIEYMVSNKLALRVGVWLDPDHSLRFTGDNKSFQAIFRQRGDETHWSAGIGFTNRRIRIDVALDYSDRFSTGSFSLIIPFERLRV